MRPHRHPDRGPRSRLLIGPEWLVEGVLSSEAGIDVVLASETSPVPGFVAAIAARRSELDRAGVTFESAENDIVLAGLLRSGLLAGRRTVAVFEMRGFRGALDMLHEAAQVPVRAIGGGVAVLCEPRWRLWPLPEPDEQRGRESPALGLGVSPPTAVGRRLRGRAPLPAMGGPADALARPRGTQPADEAARRVTAILRSGAIGRPTASDRNRAGGDSEPARSVGNDPAGRVPASSAGLNATAGATSGGAAISLAADRLPWADPRDLASYLGVTMLEPASPDEVRIHINEALRLSRAVRRLVMIWLPPSLITGGETPHLFADTAIRSVSRTLDTLPAAGEDVHPVHREARLRMLDRVANLPGPGETVPLAFITLGTTFTALRHALNLLDLTGRVPILKLAYTNPIDHQSVEMLLARSRRVVVVEAGRPVVERKVLAIAQAMRLAGERPAEVFGRWLPTQDRSGRPGRGAPTASQGGPLAHSLPDTGHHSPGPAPSRPPHLNRPSSQHGGYISELHPSELVQHLGPLLADLLPGMRARVQTRLDELQHHVEAIQTHWPDLSRPLADLPGDQREIEPWRRRHDLVHAILHHTIRILTQELAEANAIRPALRVRSETIDDTGLDPGPDERVIVTLERRRLPGVGRAAITHALRRRLNVTFVVEPDPPGDATPGVSVTESESIVRSLVATTLTGRPMVAVVDPSDGLLLQGTLRRALLGSRLAVIIVESGHAAVRTNVAGDPEEWARMGYVPREMRIRPTSGVPGLAHEWLVRHGWNAASDLDGVHGPRLELPEPNDPRATPLDGWEGFEEFRIYREQPPPEAVAWMQGLFVVDPTPIHGSQPHWRAHVCAPLGPAFDFTMGVLELAGQRMGYRVQRLHGRDAGGAFGQIAFTRPRPNESAPPVTARIPHGMADLIIALSPESLFSALDPVSGHAVASPARTHLVLDLSGGLAVATATDWGRSRQLVVPGALNRVIPPSQRVVLRAGEVCDRLLHGRNMLGAMLVGVTFQRGWIPISVDSLNRAAHRLPGDVLDHALQAIRIGRAMAQWPDGRGPGVRGPAPTGLLSSTVARLPGGGTDFATGPSAVARWSNRPQSPRPAPAAPAPKDDDAAGGSTDAGTPPPAAAPATNGTAASVAGSPGTESGPAAGGEAVDGGAPPSPVDGLVPRARARSTRRVSSEPEAMVRRHRHILARRWDWKAHARARRFEEVALGTLDAITGLRRRDPARLAEVRFVARLIDCERWGGLRYARAYADRVRAVYAAERAVNDYMVTRQVITELGRAMLVPDAIFVATTMLRPDRRRDERQRLRIIRRNGDVLTVRVHGRLRRLAGLPGVGAASMWSIGPALATVLSRTRFVRRLPWWERRNLAYRDWVLRLVDRCTTELPERASVWIEVFRQLERVRGSGWSRFDAMRRVRIAVGSLLDLSGAD